MEATKDDYLISTDKNTLNIPFIHQFLSHTYWAKGVPLETVARSIENSLCFGLYQGKKQIGFARVITDQATFAYLADVFVDEAHRGNGLSKWLVEVILQHPGLQNLRRFMLATLDAHSLYARFGFTPLPQPERIMQIHNPDVYKQSSR
jgi:GNAT superfamily N-acetyltransferase